MSIAITEYPSPQISALESKSILEDAIRYAGKDGELEYFLPSGLNLEYHDSKYKRDWVFVAAAANSPVMLKYFRDRGLPLDNRDFMNRTPLIYACKSRSLDAIAFLVENTQE